MHSILIDPIQTCIDPKTTNELNPLKGLIRLLTLVEVMEGERESLGFKSLYSKELLGKLQENLTEVLWWQLWPLYTTSYCLYMIV